MKTLLAVLLTTAAAASFANGDAEPLTPRQTEAVALVDQHEKLVQEIVDSLFSFAELGFQETETQRYLTELLEANGFVVEQGIANIPTAWWATWGEGKPVIALGTDVDGIPKSSQTPGVLQHRPLVEGAPGHGEGHNTGMGVNIAAALAVKEIVERENLPGTIVLWPGIAEELLAAKAWYVRDGYFEDVDAVLFNHVSSVLGTGWGATRGTGLVSAEFTFSGTAAHGAGDPWKGRSALDAVELMNVGWNYRREHLHPLQRSHYVIVDGGDQPNVVPSSATVWYFIREIEASGIHENFDTLKRIAEGAATMTDTTLERRIIGTAYPRHFNKPIALAMGENIQAIGMPDWSDDDQDFARAFQRFMNAHEITGLPTEPRGVNDPPDRPISGGSDDIGDISWNVPTITLWYPSNISGATFHHWSSGIAVATPIAHKGATTGAKVMAATMMELFEDEQLLKDAWAYFHDVQTKDGTYEPFITADDPPPVHKNRETQAAFREAIKPLHYDPARYDSYLEQLGIDYPDLGAFGEPRADEVEED